MDLVHLYKLTSLVVGPYSPQLPRNVKNILYEHLYFFLLPSCPRNPKINLFTLCLSMEHMVHTVFTVPRSFLWNTSFILSLPRRCPRNTKLSTSFGTGTGCSRNSARLTEKQNSAFQLRQKIKLQSQSGSQEHLTASF